MISGKPYLLEGVMVVSLYGSTPAKRTAAALLDRQRRRESAARIGTPERDDFTTALAAARRSLAA